MEGGGSKKTPVCDGGTAAENFNSQASARYQRILLIAKVLCATATWLRGITVNLVNKVSVIPKILKDGCKSTFIPSHYQHESDKSNVDKHRNELNYSKAHGAGGRTSTKLLGFGLGRGKGIETSTCSCLISLGGISFPWLAQLSSKWSGTSSLPKRYQKYEEWIPTDLLQPGSSQCTSVKAGTTFKRKKKISK